MTEGFISIMTCMLHGYLGYFANTNLLENNIIYNFKQHNLVVHCILNNACSMFLHFCMNNNGNFLFM